MAKKIGIKKTREVIEPQIRLHGIELISSSFSKQPYIEGIKDFNFNINIENKIDFDRKLVIAFVKIDIKPFDATHPIIASFQAGIGVEILNFNDVIIPDNTTSDGLIVLPKEFETVLRTIAISTMRGIMFSELRGTYLHSAILPIIITQVSLPENKN